VPRQAMKLAIQTMATSSPSTTNEVRMSIADVYVWAYH
jgi:hypothetical protein